LLDLEAEFVWASNGSEGMPKSYDAATAELANDFRAENANPASELRLSRRETAWRFAGRY